MQRIVKVTIRILFKEIIIVVKIAVFISLVYWKSTGSKSYFSFYFNNYYICMNN